MLDTVNTAAQSEDLAEHNLKTELERLSEAEQREWAARRARAERAATAKAVTAALAAEEGTRYTAPELHAACGAALSTVTKGRGQRFTDDEWTDLRADLTLAALERAAAENVRRGEQRSLLPRREDLAGKDRTDGLGWLMLKARDLVALHIGGKVTERDWQTGEHAPTETEDYPAPWGDLTAADLAALCGLAQSERALVAIRVVTEGAKLAEIGAEIGKTAKATERAAAKGREAIRDGASPRMIRQAAQAVREGRREAAPAPSGTVDMLAPSRLARGAYGARNAPIGTHRRAADIGAWIGAAEDAIVPVPAAAAERADLASRELDAPRRNREAKTRPAPTGEARRLRTGRPADVTAWIGEVLAAQDRAEHIAAARPLASPLTAERPAPLAWMPGKVAPRTDPGTHPTRPEATIGGATHAPLPPTKAHGPMTVEVTADLSRRRTADLAAAKAARNAIRKAATKVTVLESVARPDRLPIL